MGYVNRIIVPIENVIKQRRATALRHTICDDVIAFCVAIDDESAREVRKIRQLGTLSSVIKLFRTEMIDPLLGLSNPRIRL
jgi:hypothetical protein